MVKLSYKGLRASKQEMQGVFPMNDRSVGSLARLAVLLALPVAALAQTQQQTGTFAITGLPDRAILVQINGKSYVEVESLARITHGSIRFQGSQTILTLPGLASATSQPAAPTNKPAQLSDGFLRAEIETLTVIREWRVDLAHAVQTNKPVTEDWIGILRRSADSKLTLTAAAATTDFDRSAMELLRNEFANMQQLSEQFLALHAKSSYTAPDSFDSNPLDQKIMTCARGLASMAAAKQFQDEPSCH
jgi:hypothetical protein